MPRLVSTVRTAAFAIAAACGLLPAAASGQGCPCGTLADEFRAADAGLVREWIVQAPFDSAAYRLERITVGDGLVVATSGDGGIHAIHCAGSGKAAARPGTLAWSRTVPAAKGHAWPATVGTELVVMASELAVHAIDRDTGAEAWSRPTESLTAGSAVQSGAWVYAPLVTDRLLRLPVNPHVESVVEEPLPPPAGAGRDPDGAAARPTPPESTVPVAIEAGGGFQFAPCVLANGVLWSTGNGLAALERTRLGWLRHQLPESSPPSWQGAAPVALAGPPTVRGQEIYLATSAGAAARVDLNAPNRAGLRTRWTALLPDRASAAPLVSGDVVVVPLGPSGVTAVSATDGRELWRSGLVGTLVAVAGGRAWLLDSVGRLTALDLATGARRHSSCAGCFTLPVVNTSSERLVLASPGGLVVSLAPPAAPVTAGGRPARAPAPADPAPTPP